MSLALRKFQSASHLPPGVAFILHTLATKVAPIVGGGYVTLATLDAAFDIALPAPITWTVLSTSVPVVLIARAWWQSWRTRRNAKRLGAVLIPVWEGKLPGNYDRLKEMMEEFEHGYPGE